MSNSEDVENGANGMSDIEGKAAKEAAKECGQRLSFNHVPPEMIGVDRDLRARCKMGGEAAFFTNALGDYVPPSFAKNR
jgi:hypothetical protein